MEDEHNKDCECEDCQYAEECEKDKENAKFIISQKQKLRNLFNIQMFLFNLIL